MAGNDVGMRLYRGNDGWKNVFDFLDNGLLKFSF